MKEYTILIGGMPHTVVLDEAEAKAVGAVEVKRAVEVKAAPAPKNKARAPQATKG